MGKQRFEYHMIFGGTRNGSEKEYKPCEIHVAIVDACVDALTGPKSPGFFLKEEIIANAGISPYMGEHLHWVFILRHLENVYGARLVSLANSFFENHQVIDIGADGTRTVVTHGPIFERLVKEQNAAEISGDYDDCMKLAGRGIAGGNGKKTVGYAAYRPELGSLVLARLAKNTKVSGGILETNTKTVARAQAAGVKGLPPQENLLTNE